MHRPHDVADDQELGDSTIAGIRSCFGPMAHLKMIILYLLVIRKVRDRRRLIDRALAEAELVPNSISTCL